MKWNIFLILIVISGITKAQDMMGARHGNYSGIYGTMINPANVVDHSLQWDINLITVDAFIDNTYLYLPNTNIRRYLMGKDQNGSDTYNSPALHHFNNYRNKKGYTHVTILGPSVQWALNEKSGIAIHTSIRAAASINRVNYLMADFLYDVAAYGNVSNSTIPLSKFSVNGAAWGEIGISYGRILFEDDYDKWTLGGTAKLIRGMGGVTGINRNSSYALSDSQDVVPVFDFELAYAPGSDVLNNSQITPGSYLNGWGTGIDIGLEFERKKSYISRYSRLSILKRSVTYDWKWGISIIDVGGIRFGKNAERYNYDNVFTDSVLNNLDPGAITPKTNFVKGLPTALSSQFDYHIKDFWFVNATIVQRMPLGQRAIHRANFVSVTPRWETRYLELSMPVLLYEYRYPRIGAALRIGSITIGSDKIGSFIGQHNVTGSDLYIGIKISGDYFQSSNEKNIGNKKRGTFNLRNYIPFLKNSAKCYYF